MLGNCSTYVVGGNLDAFADVTIMPGTELRFESGRFYIRSGASLRAEGTADAPIIFGSATDATETWNGLVLASASTGTVLDHVVIEETGITASPYLYFAVLSLSTDSEAAVSNTTIQNTAGYGLYLRERAELSEWSNVRFADTTEAPISIRATEYPQLNGQMAFETVSMQSPWIELRGGLITESMTWTDPGLPYRVQNKDADLRLQGSDAVLTIDPGVTIEFTANESFTVTSGTLSAVGTVTQPIQFRGAEETAGFWEGIIIDSAEANVMDHVEVAYAGSMTATSPAAILVRNNDNRCSVGDDAVATLGGSDEPLAVRRDRNR